jgi:hypothetical protein
MPTAPHSRSELDLTRVDWRQVDATTDEDIARQAAEDADTAPVFTAEEILAAGRRIEPDAVDDARALRTGSARRKMLLRHASVSLSTRSVDTKAAAASQPVRSAPCSE